MSGSIRSLWALVVVIPVAINCERAREKPPEPEPPRPPGDARIADALDRTELDARLAALDRLRTYVTSTSRARSPVEAPLALTGAYVDFEFAYAYARLGRVDRARELIAAARAALPTEPDPVHGYLSSAYGARVQQAIAGAPLERAMPSGIEAEYALLDRVGRYKVDRLREVSRVLNTTEYVDAIGAFSKKWRDARGDEVQELRGVAEPVARADAIGKLVDAAIASPEHRQRLLGAALEEAFTLPRDAAATLLARVEPLIARAPDAGRAGLYARAVAVAMYCERSDRVADLTTGIAQTLPHTVPYEITSVLHWTTRALRRGGRTRELAELWKAIELHINGQDETEVKVAYAGGLLLMGDTSRARPLLEGAHAALAGDLTLTRRLEITRGLARDYAFAPPADGLAGIERMTDQFASITDSYGTNSHFSLSVVAFVDALVLGIVGD